MIRVGAPRDMPVYFPAFAGTKLYCLGVNNLPKVVAQQRRGRASNPRLLHRKSDALPLSHRATRRFGGFAVGSEAVIGHAAGE